MPVRDNSAIINYQTDADNLGLTVKVGYTNGSNAVPSTIEGRTVLATGGTGTLSVTPSVIPNTYGATETVTVTISGYVASEGKIFKDVTAANADAASTLSQDGSTITVTLSNIRGNVTLTVNEEVSVQPAVVTATHLASAGVTVTDDTDDENAVAGNRRITVIGAVEGVADDGEYGVIISNETIDEYNAANAWAAKTKNGKGAFAVQIIDDNSLFTVGARYYTAVYAKKADGSYAISSVSEFTVGQ